MTDSKTNSHAVLPRGILVVGTATCTALVLSLVRRRKRCPLCRKPIKGSLDSIRLSIFCVNCSVGRFENVTQRNRHGYCISEGDAILKSGCSATDLCLLKHVTVPPTGTACLSGRLYLRNEVWYLRNLRRKEYAERNLGFNLGDVHPLVRVFLLGDYLTKLTESETMLETILVYKDVVHRASEIVIQCQWAHPKAALDFCMTYPESGPREFQEMKEKMQRVFHLEGRRILHGLAKRERQKLHLGALGDVYKAFYAEKREKIIKGYLRRWFDAVSIDAILADHGWKDYEWASGSEDRVASRLKEFWQEKLCRRETLTNALAAKKLLMPDSCINCKAYMNGSDDLSVSEIVAGVDLSKRLRDLEFKENSDEWAVAFSMMLHCLDILKVNHYTSIEIAIATAHESNQ